jgi:hypothetical protein
MFIEDFAADVFSKLRRNFRNRGWHTELECLQQRKTGTGES